MGLMELKNKENFLDNCLTPFMETRLVKPLYTNQPKQKYRLTEQSKVLLQDDEKEDMKYLHSTIKKFVTQPAFVYLYLSQC